MGVGDSDFELFVVDGYASHDVGQSATLNTPHRATPFLHVAFVTTARSSLSKSSPRLSVPLDVIPEEPSAGLDTTMSAPSTCFAQERKVSEAERAAHDLMAAYGLAPKAGAPTASQPSMLRTGSGLMARHSWQGPSSYRPRGQTLNKARSFDGSGRHVVPAWGSISGQPSDAAAPTSAPDLQLQPLPLPSLPRIKTPPPAPLSAPHCTVGTSVQEPPTPGARTAASHQSDCQPAASNTWEGLMLDVPRTYRPSPLGRRASDGTLGAVRFPVDTSRDVHAALHDYLATNPGCSQPPVPTGMGMNKAALSWSGAHCQLSGAGTTPAAGVDKGEALGGWVQSLETDAVLTMQLE